MGRIMPSTKFNPVAFVGGGVLRWPCTFRFNKALFPSALRGLRMTDAPKKRGRPPKLQPAPVNDSPDPREAASEFTGPDVVITNAYDAGSMLKSTEGHQVDTAYRNPVDQDIAESARTQPEDAAYITTEHAEEQMEQAQHDAPVHEQGHSRRRSHKEAIGELELAAFKDDAWDVAQSQEELIRFDTIGRRWRFYPDQTERNEAQIVFEIRKGEDVREYHHSRAAYGTETAREQSDQIVTDLNGAL